VAENVEKPAAVEHPRGIYPAKIDDKGRLKLPADFQQYLTGINETKVFCTSFDVRIARLYPISKWKEIEMMLKEPADDAEAAEDLWFTAMDLGGDADMDQQGRLMIPAELRRALSIENKSVYLEHYKGHINLFGEEVYAERKQRAAANRAEKLKIFEKKGLQ
jgi:MraZ protein